MTPRPDRRAGARRIVAVIVSASALAVGAAACGGSDDPPTVQELVVPRGTAEKLSQGETVNVVPSLMEFEVGDTLRIRNEDVAGQAVGPYQVAAQDEFEITFGSPGRYVGACSLNEDERYEIVITE